MINEDKIREQAKQIMDEFILALEGAELDSGFGTIREKQLREPTEPEEGDFRERMFKNAPKKNEDYIITRKKGW